MGRRHEAAVAAEASAKSARRRTFALFVVASLVVAGGVAWVVAHRGAGGGGDVVVEPDPIEFGAHPYGDRVDKVVRVVNRSDQAVTIRDPTFDCGCFMLVTPPPTLRIEPGIAIELTLRMETTKAFPGAFRKTMTVQVDAPVRATLAVPVLGEVIDYREITPRDVAFGLVPAAGPAAERRVTVRGGKGGSKIDVESAVSQEPRVVSVAVEPGKDGADLVLRTVAGASPGRFRMQVALVLAVRKGDGGEPHRYDETIWVTGELR